MSIKHLRNRVKKNKTKLFIKTQLEDKELKHDDT